MAYLLRLISNHVPMLLKTASYYVVHVLVAAGITFAVTGSAIAALTLSLLEPSVQALAYFGHEKLWSRYRHLRYRALVKSLTYYAMHLVVAASVAYAVTGDWLTALTLSLLEPTVQMLSFYLHERVWEKKIHPQLQATMQACTTSTPRSLA